MKKTKKDFYIYGRNPVEDILSFDPSKVKQVLLSESVKAIEFEKIRSLCKENKVVFNSVPKTKLKEIFPDTKTQGVVALLSEFQYLNIDQLTEGLNLRDNPSILLVDEVEDPHNMGALIRTAKAAGLSGVVLGQRRQALINATVFKTSAGSVINMPVALVPNINQALLDLKEKGFWIVGVDQNAKKNIGSEDLQMPCVFVLGGEADGLREKVREKCDFAVKIPMSEEIDSLNVSVAGALTFYEWRRQNKLK